MPRAPYPTVYPDPARPPRAAAAVLLVRDLDDPEIFVVRRNPKLRFLGGFGGYPGGRVDRADAEIAGIEDRTRLEVAEVAALRELYEEAGVLLSPGGDAVHGEAFDRERKRLLDGDTNFAALCERLGVPPRPAPGTLIPVGRWVTPFYSPLRFDTHYFLHVYEGEREPVVWHGELVEGWWTRPADLLATWRRSEIWLAPPVTETLYALAEGLHPVEELRERLVALGRDRGHPFQPVRMRHGLRMLPLRSRTLPPAVFTNTYIVGEREIAVVDPGAGPCDSQQILFDQLDRLLADGRRLRAVLLTHHHVDHIDSAAALRERYDVPLLAHPRTAEALAAAQWAPYRPEATALQVDGALEHGYRLELEGGWTLEVVHTPGHTRGHVCLVEHFTGSLLAGDLVSGLSPVIVDPPGGDMGAYLLSLERARDLGDFGLFPGHGPPATSSATRLELLLRHRLWRQDRVVETLRQAPDGLTVEEIVPLVYDDVPLMAHLFAARTLLAHLHKLERDGIVVEREDGCYQIPTTDDPKA